MIELPFTGQLTDQQVRRTWRLLEALRSGRYTQGTGKLLSNGMHCCLGVGSEICNLAKKYLEGHIYATFFYLNGKHSGNVPPKEWWISYYGWDYDGLPCKTKDGIKNHYSLYELNDDGWSFDEIADLIEDVFIDKVEHQRAR